MKDVGKLSLCFKVWILFLNNLCRGLISFNFIFLGRLLMLWWDLIVIEGLLEKFMDLIILG